MAPSQLKQLKASLRESGVIGPQQSKKQKKRHAQNVRDQDKIQRRNAALQGIREKFKPFEAKAPPRPNKFDVTSSKTINGQTAKGVHGRPGVTKGLGEERVS
jgi:nucleolar protein 14